jgi:hypothetical protein
MRISWSFRTRPDSTSRSLPARRAISCGLADAGVTDAGVAVAGATDPGVAVGSAATALRGQALSSHAAGSILRRITLQDMSYL